MSEKCKCINNLQIIYLFKHIFTIEILLKLHCEKNSGISLSIEHILPMCGVFIGVQH